ncbi:Uncharacterised protein [Vibrio cholerae]|nr:Uncharacterised protein [Vibrio cholerae]
MYNYLTCIRCNKHIASFKQIYIVYVFLYPRQIHIKIHSPNKIIHCISNWGAN